MKRTAVMLCLLMVFSVFAIAQNTTSTITGVTSDSDDILPGAVVKVTEVESGVTYSAISNQKGQFRITGLTPGGPYRLEVSYVGYKKSVIDIKRISLGEVYSCDVNLTAGNELQEVIVKGQAAALRKTGSSENISSEDIDNKATIDRSLQDILAMSPYYIGSGSFGGRDGGMNNYSVDGANFITNAVKFTPEGGIIMGWEVNDDTNKVELYVEDTGIGLSEEDRKMVFSRFFKKDEFKQGTGLGLSICKLIVSRLGGSIKVKSQLGKGSRFSVFLSIQQD